LLHSARETSMAHPADKVSGHLVIKH
jgi:hypothetical protein